MVLQWKILISHLLLVTASGLVLAFAPQHSCAQQQGSFAGYHFKKPVGYVNDFEHLFSKAEADTLSKIIIDNQQKTTNQIAVVTIHDSMITRENFNNYVTAMHNNWGVGTKEKNNGVLICIVPGLQMVRISNGYGIEVKMSDEETEQIITDFILPAFKTGNYYLGTKNALIAIINKIK